MRDDVDATTATEAGPGGVLGRRATLWLIALAFAAVSVIGGVGMGLAGAVAEAVQGSAGAINSAGNLRRLAFRAGIVASAGAGEWAPAAAAIDAFEAGLGHPALQSVVSRAPRGRPAALYRDVRQAWRLELKPRLLAAAIPAARTAVPAAALLADVDAFVARIDTLVSALEHDSETALAQLRATLALALVALALVAAAALYAIRRRVFVPLAELRACATRVAAGDFAARCERVGPDELGRMATAFNRMADDLATAYRTLELRVAQKTADLTRSNRTLELLYHAIARLHRAPGDPATYRDTMQDLEQVLGLRGSFACALPKRVPAADVLASSIGACPDRRGGERPCADCPARALDGLARVAGQLLVPLRDGGQLHGVIRLVPADDGALEAWQLTLIDAIARHIAVALGLARQSERERLLALQEERSVIARELHDSLAQSLSYMKIQASLLGPAMREPSPRAEALGILSDLREGISGAYRQLRELLSTFRLRMDGEFADLLGRTVEEYAGRGGVPIDLDVDLGRWDLDPNQEVHVLHIIREALSNATRHAGASRIRVALSAHADGRIELAVDDDGIGLQGPAGPHHYGLAIMGERARGLGGVLRIEPRAGGGTRLGVRFGGGTKHNVSSGEPSEHR